MAKSAVTLTLKRTIKRDYAIGKVTWEDNEGNSGVLGYFMESTPRLSHIKGGTDNFGKAKKLKAHNHDSSLLIKPGVYDIDITKSHPLYSSYFNYSPSGKLLVEAVETVNYPDVQDFEDHDIFHIKVKGNKHINILWDISEEDGYNSIIVGEVEHRDDINNLKYAYVEFYEFMREYSSWIIRIDQA